jgi:hypothetical protein
MSQFTQATYDVARPTGQCAFTGRALEPGEAYMATLVECDPDPQAAKPDGPATAAAALGLRRVDVSMDAWDTGRRPPRLFSHWKAVAAAPTHKKKLLVDDHVLLNLMQRLEDTEDPQRLAFRFVLCLILMRKRLLRYDGAEQRSTPDGLTQEWWIVRPRSQQGQQDETRACHVLNPHLDESRIEQVTSQLGEILEAEL